MSSDTKNLLEIYKGNKIQHQQIHYKFADTLLNHQFDLDICQKVFTITSELVNNAIDHGLLQLSSGLKDQENGMEQFYSLRDKQLQQLTHNHKLVASLQWRTNGEIRIQVSHNGRGCYPVRQSNPGTLQCSGRGLLLIRALSSEYECLEGGRLTRVKL
nr:ATP-binding protein [Marinospirillum sp.]